MKRLCAFRAGPGKKVRLAIKPKDIKNLPLQFNVMGQLKPAINVKTKPQMLPGSAICTNRNRKIIPVIKEFRQHITENLLQFNVQEKRKQVSGVNI